MNKRDAVFYLNATRFTIFTTVSVLVTGLLIAIMGGFGLGSQTEYKAIFTSASEISAGDDVRIAGVVVGKVKDVKIYQRENAMVTFKVKDAVPLTDESEANIRFLNLIGDRYMSLSEGGQGAKRLSPGATLPMSRTTPSLNLTDLFQGFQPLFQALQPEDVNKLSLNLVKVLQGEGGTVQELLANTASLTNTLADRDELIGEVINNLSTLMGTIDEHHQELDDLIVSMKDWFGDLAKDRKVIGSSLTNISNLTESLASLLTQSRPLLKADIAELRRLFTVLAKPENKAIMDETLEKLPPMLAKQTRIGVYGSWYNYYLCEFDGGFLLPKELVDPLPADVRDKIENFQMYSNATRCEK